MFKIELISLDSHNTLKLLLGDYSYFVDLYYYCLDSTFLEEDRTTSKGLLNFMAMIENWKLKIKKLNIYETDFLPYDYSDQYIGFFVISKICDEKISIQAACTTEYTGPEINPSQLYLKNFIINPYYVKDEKYTVNINQLLQDIEDSIINILSDFYRNAPDFSTDSNL